MAKTNQYDSDLDTGSDYETNRTDALKERVSGLGDSASGQIDNSPLIALGAGLALGAVLGAVLPTSRREQELLAPLGQKINEAGTGAIDRARDLGKTKFDEMAGDKLREFMGAGSDGKSA